MASSARRAGYNVIAIDLFGDEDLQAIADVVHVVPFDEYPQGIASFLPAYPRVPVCYTGGIENSPDLMEQLAFNRPLWGNNSSIVSRVRNLFEFFPTLRENGFACPAITKQPPQDARGKTWLKKPYRSAGGIRVAVWDRFAVGDDEYLQEYISGTSYSSLFVGRERTACYLGSSRQLLLGDVTKAAASEHRPFEYAGSIGPLSLPSAMTARVQALGTLLTVEFGLRGLFGIDWIDHHGEVYLIEVNPRSTASFEVIEPTLPDPVFHYHAKAFESSSDAYVVPLPSKVHRVTGKLILFAPYSGVLSHDAPSYQFIENEVGFADVPRRGTTISKGFPILTILTRGACENSVRERLITYGETFIHRFFLPTE